MLHGECVLPRGAFFSAVIACRTSRREKLDQLGIEPQRAANACFRLCQLGRRFTPLAATSRLSVGAVYDRQRCHTCRIVGGQDRPYKGTQPTSVRLLDWLLLRQTAICEDDTRNVTGRDKTFALRGRIPVNCRSCNRDALEGEKECRRS